MISCRAKLVVVFSIVCSLASANYTGLLLRQGTGVKALGMGGAYTAIADDTSALFYNPAGLAKTGSQWSYMGDDTSRVNSAVALDNSIKLGNIAYGRRRYYQANQFADIHSYGFGINTKQGIDYGLTFKHISQDTLGQVGDGWSADVGTMFRFTPNYQLGLNFQNISAYNTGTKPSGRVGLATWQGDFVFAYDQVFFDDKESVLDYSQKHFGIQWNVSSGFALRAGRSNSNDTVGFSLGLAGLLLEYAYEHSENDYVYRFGVKLGSEYGQQERNYTILPRKEILEITIDSSLVAGQSSHAVFGGLHRGGDYLIEKIRLAASDRDIAAITIRLSDLPNSLGYLPLVEEIRAELSYFKSKGKSVYVYIDGDISANGYYLASVADMVYISRFGSIYSIGKSLTVTRYKGFLEKIGLDFNVVSQGEYKDSLSPYRAGFSELQRSHLQELVDDVNDRVLNNIQTARGLSAETLANIKDGSIISAADAFSEGLVDGIAYYEKFKDKVKKDLRLDHEPKLLSLSQLPFYELDHTIFADHRTIAVVDIDGAIVRGKTTQDMWFGEKSVGAESVCSELSKLKDKDEVRAVILRINSPGGDAMAADMIHEKLLELKKEGKIVVASMGNVAASGGYYIAAAADYVFANANTLTGSIGVIGGVWKSSGLYEMLDIREESIKTGEHMDMSSVGKDLTESELVMLQLHQKRVYDRFKKVVADGRKLHLFEVEQIAQGKIFSGAQAVENGLVDEIGTFYDAVAWTTKKANIRFKPRIIRIIKVEDRWFTLNSKVSTMLGLDQLSLNALRGKPNFVEMKSYLY